MSISTLPTDDKYMECEKMLNDMKYPHFFLESIKNVSVNDYNHLMLDIERRICDYYNKLDDKTKEKIKIENFATRLKYELITVKEYTEQVKICVENKDSKMARVLLGCDEYFNSEEELRALINVLHHGESLKIKELKIFANLCKDADDRMILTVYMTKSNITAEEAVNLFLIVFVVKYIVTDGPGRSKYNEEMVLFVMFSRMKELFDRLDSSERGKLVDKLKFNHGSYEVGLWHSWVDGFFHQG